MRNRESGFTLSEALFVLFVGSCVAALAAGLMVRSRRAADLGQDAATVVQEAARTLDALERDLRGAAAVEEAGDGVLRGAGPGGGFSWTLRRGRLVRADGAGERIVASGIRSFRAERRGRLVEATLRYAPRDGGGTPPPLSTAVALRAGEEGK